MQADIRKLSLDEHGWLEAGLQLAIRLSGSAGPMSIEEVQALYDVLLAEAAPDPDHIIALGLGFGDQIRRHGSFEWLRVRNEYGEETCVGPDPEQPSRVSGLFCAPVSMVQKRLKRGEVLDFEPFRNDIVARMKELIEGGGASTDR